MTDRSLKQLEQDRRETVRVLQAIAFGTVLSVIFGVIGVVTHQQPLKSTVEAGALLGLVYMWLTLFFIHQLRIIDEKIERARFW